MEATVLNLSVVRECLRQYRDAGWFKGSSARDMRNEDQLQVSKAH